MRLLICLLAGLWITVVHAQAPTSSYLTDVIAELEKSWPANRTVNLVFHGHSVPAGYFKTPEVRSLEAYPNLVRVELARRFPHATFNVIVTAMGGEDSVHGAERFETDVLTHHPDVVFIDYGLNDRRVGLAAARAAWTKMINSAGNSGVKLILLTPTPDMNSHLGDPAHPLEQQAAQIRRLAAGFNVGLADSLAAFRQALDSTPLPDLMSQANHPNGAGHRLVATEILKYFEPK